MDDTSFTNLRQEMAVNRVKNTLQFLFTGQDRLCNKASMLVMEKLWMHQQADIRMGWIIYRFQA